MKYIKLYEDFFGKNLWSDKTYPDRGYSRGWTSAKQFQDYIEKMYDSDELEKNTSKEDQLLLDIEYYLSSGDSDIQRNIGLLKKLLKYKKLYPEMLDPAQTLRPADMVYRGMTMPFDEVHDAIDSCDSIAKMSGNYHKYVILKGAKRYVRSRQNNGFLSATTSLGTATRFQDPEEYDTRWPIVAAAQFSKIEKKCIMNPDFLNVLNPMDESETWILGNQIDVRDIYLKVFNPKFYPIAMKRYPKYADLMTRIWGIYNDNRTKQQK